jgi:hypothetical protein
MPAGHKKLKIGSGLIEILFQLCFKILKKNYSSRGKNAKNIDIS